MKIQCWSVGKNHESYVADGTNDFTNRISRYFPVSWSIIAVPKNASSFSADEQKKMESKAILDRITKEDYLVALDEQGKEMSSVQLAGFIQSRANENVRQLIFLIGGAFGLDEAVLRRANFSWSLSRLTFPHQLVRLILAEQIYRACTILRNEKYHHD